ncbi:MAG: hypothetical protein EOO43_00650, partial [Flavobacterium sp.]
EGFKFEWEKDFTIETKVVEGEILILANKAGLISLARHLLSLAQESVPEGYHIHFDEYNSLEDGSVEIILQKA